MKAVGQTSFPIGAMLILILFSLVSAVPANSVAVAIQSDDFNQCGLNNSVWAFENTGHVPAVTTNGAYVGDSSVVLKVPGGQDYTFSNKNTKAPRIMQPVPDASFEVEAKFSSPLGQTPSGTYNIQGILVKDTTSVPGKTRWLRFDLNTNSTSINYYVAYLDENGSLFPITGPQIISSQMSISPLFLRVKYDQPTGTWSVGYALTDPASFRYKFTFKEATAPNVPGGFKFNVSDIGVFAGSTSPTGSGTPPGIVSNIDYFRNMSDTTFVDDNIALSVQKAGPGTVSQQCSGNKVTLTANPSNGAAFTSWSGDISSQQATIDLVMTKSYKVTATFAGSPENLPFKTFISLIPH